MPTLEHPPVDFPVYGMDETWAGPRWLDHLEGAGGEPLIGVWLAHGPQLDPVEHPGPWARVVTVPRRRWPAEGGRDPVSEVADLTKPLGFPESVVTSRERALGTDD